MAEPKWTDMRPAGEWLVELYRPMTRFGWYLRVGIHGSDGRFYVARWNNGEWEFCEHERNVEPPSALFMDDILIAKMGRLFSDHLQNLGKRISDGDSVGDHLADALEMRDRLLIMVERKWNSMVGGH